MKCAWELKIELEIKIVRKEGSKNKLKKKMRFTWNWTKSCKKIWKLYRDVHQSKITDKYDQMHLIHYVFVFADTFETQY